MDKIILPLMSLLALCCVAYGDLPEETMNVPEIVRHWGYPVETHEVMTMDGYYLTMHRIPHGKDTLRNGQKKPIMFLQHGLLCSSSNWVVNRPDQSLGFMLADAGFDVWMGNTRGNTYSKRHVSYKINSDEFWDFSFEEMAMYDLPAMVDYALEFTGQYQLYYVGHSQGTMIAFAELSENKMLQQQIKVFFALAPVTRLRNVYSPVKYMSYFESGLKLVSSLLRIREFLPSAESVKYLAEKVCPIQEKLCDRVLFLISGYDKTNLNATRTPVYLSHTPAGTSMKNMYHFSQLVQDGNFQKYDYGYIGNLRKYESWSPEQYDLQKVNASVVLISGTVDWLAAPKDVDWLFHQLPRVIYHRKVVGYNHLDFIWGISASNEVYRPIINMARNFERLERV